MDVRDSISLSLDIYGVIYEISNSKNSKVYIGQTTAPTLKTRAKDHRHQAKAMTRKPLYYAMRKYGIENFTMKPVAVAHSKEELDELEKFYIKKRKTLTTENGYNLLEGGDSGGKHSEETKQKLRKIHQKRNATEDPLAKAERIKKISISLGKPIVDSLGMIFASMREAARYHKIDPGDLSRMLNGTRKTPFKNGLTFRYCDKNPVMGHIGMPQKKTG